MLCCVQPLAQQRRRSASSPDDVKRRGRSGDCSQQEEEEDDDERDVRAAPIRILASAYGYDLGRMIGRGGLTDEVRLLLDRDARRFVGKFYVYGEEDDGDAQGKAQTQMKREHHRREVAAMSKLAGGVGCPNIVSMRAAFDNGRTLHCVVVDYMASGDMFDYVKRRTRLTEQECVWLGRGVFRALAYCHANHVVHGDVKLENLFVADPTDLSTVKLADFGLSAVADDREESWMPLARRRALVGGESCDCSAAARAARRVRGTVPYMAPEVVDATMCPVYESDVWCAAVACLIGMIGYVPFYPEGGEREDGRVLPTRSNVQQMVEQHARSSRIVRRALADVGASDVAERFFRRALDVSPYNRPSAQQCLEHQWLIQ